MTDPISTLILGPGAITTFSKLVTDAIKRAYPQLDGAWTLLVAFIAALVGATLILLAGSAPITRQAVAIAILQAVVATGAAVGVTELQKSSTQAQLEHDVKEANDGAKSSIST